MPQTETKQRVMTAAEASELLASLKAVYRAAPRVVKARAMVDIWLAAKQLEDDEEGLDSLPFITRDPLG